MSKLTFGIEMEIFIKNNINLHKLITKEIKDNGFTTLKEFVEFIITKTTYDKDIFKDEIETSDFIINNNIVKLPDFDIYIIMLIITYIISSNESNISFTLINYETFKDNDIIYFKDYDKKLKWHYTMDGTVKFYRKANTYRTIYDNFPQILLHNDVINNIEFVSGIYNNPLEVKEGVNTLISSITDYKLTPLHSEDTSNHIHFSIKKERDTDLGIKDPYLVFCITFVFYVLQNFIYLLCLPERRKSEYCIPLVLMLNYSAKNFDEFTLDEFFNALVTMKIPKGDEKCYLDHTEIEKLKNKLSSKSNIKDTSKQLIKKIESLNTQIKNLTTLPTDIINKPFKTLKFEHQLIVLMHFYHQYTTCVMNDTKYYINIKPYDSVDRYKILNLKKLSQRKSCTLELRVKHGSNDATEIANFCILIEKLVNVAEQMVLNKHIPLLKSLCTILKVDESDIIYFKSKEPPKLHLHYTIQKPLLKEILKGLFKEDTDSIKYWIKHLERINGIRKEPSSTKSSSSKNTV